MHRQRDEKLLELQQRLMLMGRLSQTMIDQALKMLVERQATYADQVFAREKEVNALQLEVDDRAVKLTALQQPVASDVRFLFMASRIAMELERIADQAVNICQSAETLLKAQPLKPLVDLPIMAEIAQDMVRGSLEALANSDCAKAEQVLEEEEKVDALRDQIFRELLTYMISDPATIPRAIALILISRHLERVGDHATNIAEEVIYMVKGDDVRHQNPPEAGPGDEAPPAKGVG